MIMDLRQQTAAFPRAIVVIDAGPRWQILWHIAPLATRFVDVKNPVEDFQVRVLSGSAKGRGFGETVGNEVPFGRGEIGCISHPKVNRGKRILVQLQNARSIIIQSKISLFKQALRHWLSPGLRPCGSGIPPGYKPLWLTCPVVVSPAARKRPPATGCQPCRVGLVTRKVLGNLTDACAGTHQSELDAALVEVRGEAFPLDLLPPRNSVRPARTKPWLCSTTTD